jgi:hypothetical protein
VDGDDGQEGGGKGVLLAVAILLIWLAGVLLWIAFEGTSVLPAKLPVGPGGKPSYFLGILQVLAGQVQDLEKTGVDVQQQQLLAQDGG